MEAGVGRDGGDVNCVGAFIRDERNRVYVHRRSPDRRLLPGIWDVVGGHVERGETAEQTLAREVEEETGWTLRKIEAVIAEWEWLPDERHTTDEANRFPRLERYYLIDVDGDLSAPRLEEGKHDAYSWVGPDDLDLMMIGRIDGDRRLRDLVAKASGSGSPSGSDSSRSAPTTWTISSACTPTQWSHIGLVVHGRRNMPPRSRLSSGRHGNPPE